MDEIILTGVCTNQGILIKNTPDAKVFGEMNAGKKCVLTVRLEENYSEKERMYAFYYGPILAAAVQGYTGKGYEGVDKVSADYMLAAEFLKGFVKTPDGEMVPTVLSKKNISKERLLKYVQDCILFVEKELEWQVPDSLEWKTFQVTGRKLKNVK